MVGHRHDGRRPTSGQAASGSTKRATTATTYSGRPRATNILGSHQLRYGVEYEDITYLHQIDADRPDLHHAGRQADGDRRRGQHPAGPARTEQIYRVTRANLSNVREYDPALPRLLRAGHLEVATADDEARRPLRAGEADRQRLKDFTLKNNWAPRLGATWDRSATARTKVFANYGRFFARCRTTWRRAHCRLTPASAAPTISTRTDPAGTRGRSGGTDRGYAALHHLWPQRITPSIPTRSPPTRTSGSPACSTSWFADLSVGATYMRRRFGRILEDVGTAPIVAYFLGRRDRAASSTSSRTPVRALRSPADVGAPVSFEDAIHDYDAVELTAEQALPEQLGPPGVVPLVATPRHIRRVLPQRQRPVRSSHHVAVRLPDQRSDLHVDRRATIRLSGRHPLPGHRGAGPLPLDRPHQIKVYGNYRYPWGSTWASDSRWDRANR